VNSFAHNSLEIKLAERASIGWRNYLLWYQYIAKNWMLVSETVSTANRVISANYVLKSISTAIKSTFIMFTIITIITDRITGYRIYMRGKTK